MDKGRDRTGPEDEPKKKKKRVKQPDEDKPDHKRRRPADHEEESGKKKAKKMKKNEETPKENSKDGSDQAKAEVDIAEEDIVGLVSDHKELKKRLPVEAYHELGFDAVASYMSKNVHLISEARKLHKEVIRPFQGLSSEQALKQLSDPSCHMKLVLPSSSRSSKSPDHTFTYVGRRVFTTLRELMKRAPKLKLRGHPGRGKSYLLAAMACYLHTYEDAAYILTSRMVGKFEYLVEALLLAYSRDLSKQLEILARSASQDALWRFFKGNKPVILMDEVNELEETASFTQKQRVAARWWQTRVFHRGVSCASTFQSVNKADDGTPFKLNQPFDMDELAGWLSANDLDGQDFHELIYYTGLVPRLLEQYRENKDGYIDEMQQRMSTFMVQLADRDLAEHLRQVLDGTVERLDSLAFLDRRLFYERPCGDAKPYVCVLPFLEANLRAEMDERRTDEALRQQKDAFLRRIRNRLKVLKQEKAQGLEIPALDCWLAEYIAKECMLLHRQCLDGMTFARSAAYTDRAEAREKELDKYTEKNLKKGMLFYPVEGEARYADLHHVKLSDNGKTLKVTAIQISISSWKKKMLKGSHVEWEVEEKHNWERKGCKTDAKFIYILSNALRETKDLPSWVSTRKLADVHECLTVLDELKDPECPLQTCMGKTKEKEPCRKNSTVILDQKRHPADKTTKKRVAK